MRSTRERHLAASTIAYASAQTKTSNMCAAIKTDTVAAMTQLRSIAGWAIFFALTVRATQTTDVITMAWNHDVADTDAGTHDKLTPHVDALRRSESRRAVLPAPFAAVQNDSTRCADGTAALREFSPLYVRYGSIASHRQAGGIRAMSASPPIADMSMRSSRTPLCARNERMCPSKLRRSVAMLYSIISSARIMRDSGTSIPSALAVLRLITSSYLVGC